jgi:bifunctional DNA-binding transcriptional regulator/antitoxin component of YhaV-PrlF toxin-antitoxin module
VTWTNYELIEGAGCQGEYALIYSLLGSFRNGVDEFYYIKGICRILASRKADYTWVIEIDFLEVNVELVKLGKKGQVTIPRAILRSVGLTADAPLLVQASPDGAIVLRPAAVYPIEIYSDERVEEFEHENAVPEDLQARVKETLDRGR